MRSHLFEELKRLWLRNSSRVSAIFQRKNWLSFILTFTAILILYISIPIFLLLIYLIYDYAFAAALILFILRRYILPIIQDHGSNDDDDDDP